MAEARRTLFYKPPDRLSITEPKHGATKLKLTCGNYVLFIRQIAQRMCRFSTRYVPCNDGTDICRMFGKLPFDTECDAIFGFPTTNDPGSYIPRTHGKWWDLAPSGSKPDFMPQNNAVKGGHDFVDFLFDMEVYPLRVCIFEAFNPGCIIGIWAESYDENRWYNLWSGPVEHCSPTNHRIFWPTIKACHFKTRLLRFELSHSHLEYYTQLEGAFLMGTTELIVPLEESENPYLRTLYHYIKTPKNYAQFQEQNQLSLKVIQEDLSNLKRKINTNWALHKSANINKVSYGTLFSLISLVKFSNKTVLMNDTHNIFDVLPDEVILKILKICDLRTLCRCSQVNRRFYSLTRDALLYTDLNLKAYWNVVDTAALRCLTPRCKYLRRLDMSWSGNYDNSMIQPNEMAKFIDDCGKLLTNLRLNCCQYVDDIVVQKISYCKDLVELCLNNCQGISENGFKNLDKLQSLEQLELYRTKITTPILCSIIQRNPKMRHLNLAEVREVEMNNLAKKIVEYCPNLESIDCWYSRSLSFDGLKTFSQCTNLREIDFGWCPKLYKMNNRREDSMRIFLSGCSSLEKIVLTAQPFLTDRDLEILFSNQKLQQLHLAGTNNIPPEFFIKLLSRCSELRMIDLNCYQDISESQVLRLRAMYPSISIKWRSCPRHQLLERNY